MLDYWEAVRDEVVNSSNEEYPFYFTNMGYWQQKRTDHGVVRVCSKLTKQFVNVTKTEKKYYLINSIFGPIVLTRREAQCIYYLIKGFSMFKISEKLLLSPRTVEYYSQNAKRKLGCRGRQKLMYCINKTNFLEAITFKYD